MQGAKEDIFFVNTKSLYYTSLHLRLSSLFYLFQLVDIFSYEVKLASKSLSLFIPANNNRSTHSILVHNFHSPLTQSRLYFFSTNLSSAPGPGTLSLSIPSVTLSELFFSANWLEREVSEFHGITFLGKKDLRNLMLQYGDLSSPLQKSFPTVGLKEVYYNPVKDVIVQNPVTLQT